MTLVEDELSEYHGYSAYSCNIKHESETDKYEEEQGQCKGMEQDDEVSYIGETKNEVTDTDCQASCTQDENCAAFEYNSERKSCSLLQKQDNMKL